MNSEKTEQRNKSEGNNPSQSRFSVTVFKTSHAAFGFASLSPLRSAAQHRKGICDSLSLSIVRENGKRQHQAPDM
jgi:hypothetical protein